MEIWKYLDKTSGLVLDGSMTSHESHAVAGMEWSVEGDDQTLISISNASNHSDELNVQLFTTSATVDLPPLRLAAGEIALLNLQSIANATALGGTSGTFSVRGSHAMQFPRCWWEPICTGSCSKGLHYSTAINTPGCYPSGAPFIQCFGLSINGRCIVRDGICHFQGVPGFCT